MRWDNTRFVEERLDGVRKNGSYRGRPIIHRDSPIDGGIYLGAHQREAIVVDSILSPLLLDMYEDAKARITDWKWSYKKGKIPRAVYTLVPKRLRYDEAKVDSLVRRHESRNDGEILMEEFLQEGYGICRHQALAAGFLMERFKKEGIIKGQVSVDRNVFDGEGHAWCRYTTDAGTVTIIDPGRFLGTLEESLKELKWAYWRENDWV